jgi:C-terminal processing protease CtpA/Prc
MDTDTVTRIFDRTNEAQHQAQQDQLEKERIKAIRRDILKKIARPFELVGKLLENASNGKTKLDIWDGVGWSIGDCYSVYLSDETKENADDHLKFSFYDDGIGIEINRSSNHRKTWDIHSCFIHFIEQASKIKGVNAQKFMENYDVKKPEIQDALNQASQ